MGPGPHPHSGDGHSTRVPETSGWAGAQWWVCRGRRNGSPGLGPTQERVGLGCSLQRCRDDVSSSGEPFWELPPMWQTPLLPAHQGRKGASPPGWFCMVCSEAVTRRHGGPRTLLLDAVACGVQAAEAVRVRVWLGAAGVPAFPGLAPVQRITSVQCQTLPWRLEQEPLF